jgi:hypothetical protein
MPIAGDVRVADATSGCDMRRGRVSGGVAAGVADATGGVQPFLSRRCMVRRVTPSRLASAVTFSDVGIGVGRIVASVQPLQFPPLPYGRWLEPVRC